MHIGMWSMTIFVAGVLMGVSMFTLPASLFVYGYYSWIGWIICTICTLFLIKIFSDLAERFPGSGGPYQYTCQAYGKNIGFIIGILHLMVIILQIGSVGYVLELHLQEILHTNHMMYFAIVCSGLVNSFNFSTSTYLVVIMNIIKLIPVLLLILFGIPYINLYNCFCIKPIMSSTPALCGAVVMIIYAFSGIEFGLIGDTTEIENPQITIPKALLYGTIIAAITFILTQAIVWSVATPDSTAPLADAAKIIFTQSFGMQYGTVAYNVLLGSGILFAWNALNTSILISGYLIGVMAKNNHMPEVLRLERSPAPAIWFAVSLSIFAAILFTGGTGYQTLFRLIIETSNIILAFVFLITVLAYRKLICNNHITYYLGLVSASLLFIIGFVGLASF